MSFEKIRRWFSGKETIPSRPQGQIRLLRQIWSDCTNYEGGYSFEKQVTQVDLVAVSNHCYLRVTDYNCTAEGNGRPCSQLDEYFYPLRRSQAPALSEMNWREIAAGTPAYHDFRCSYDVLY